MSEARFIVGDVLDVLATLEPDSVDLVLTSPPFLNLRSYLPADHADKGREIGSEATPGEFIDRLLDVTEACARVLAPHGSLAFELGDSYSGSGGAGGDYGPAGLRADQPAFAGSAAARRHGHDPMRSHSDDLFHSRSNGRWRSTDSDAGGKDGWPMDKSLCLVPESFRWALVYGHNPHTGRETPRWRARNVIRWVRPNPPVGSLGDKVRPATSEMVVACRARDRWFDLDAVRSVNNPERTADKNDRAMKNRAAREAGTEEQHRMANGRGDGEWNQTGAPPLDWWDMVEAVLARALRAPGASARTLSVALRDAELLEWGDALDLSAGGFAGAHYAVWPPELCVRPIESMCPRRVCRSCGQPSRRIVDSQRLLDGEPADLPAIGDGERMGEGASGLGHWRKTTERTTEGWTSCGCAGADGIRLDGYHSGPAWRPGLVLDPFAGSGTTLRVASDHSRAAIGIDIDERNADLARERCGMFLEVETLGGPEQLAGRLVIDEAAL